MDIHSTFYNEFVESQKNCREDRGYFIVVLASRDERLKSSILDVIAHNLDSIKDGEEISFKIVLAIT